MICSLDDQINEHLSSPSHVLASFSQTQLFQFLHIVNNIDD